MKAQLRKRLARYLRKLRGTESQARFAKRIGIAQSSLQRIEVEDQNLTMDTLEHLCNRLKCDIGDLFPLQEETE
ncbi:MAG: hypothetical protein ETSY1_23475 [Candidatus Entotheonella factor]|uniref:HTH cro/C1-type domain-containing protein n=1 Tax=Entotheonella factor TaxID=1429438 RepID=W4LIR3_ENTF1|nr:MAG: hypothetical protein ETSY1_23475 [Candidatus Entotheonella factor]